MKRNAIHRASSLVVAFALIISLLTVSSCKMRNLKIHINDFSRTETQVPNPMKGFVSFFGENDPDSSIEYVGLTFRDIYMYSNGHGEINKSLIGSKLFSIADSGHTAVLRVYMLNPGRVSADETGLFLPEELYDELNARGEIYSNQVAGGLLEYPDFNSEKLIECMIDFIQQLGSEYDGHPVLAAIQMGLYGSWGEWNMSACENSKCVMTDKNLSRIIETYVASFKNTKLMGRNPTVGHANEYPIGYHDDNFLFNTSDFHTKSNEWKALLRKQDYSYGTIQQFYDFMNGNGGSYEPLWDLWKTQMFGGELSMQMYLEPFGPLWSGTERQALDYCIDQFHMSWIMGVGTGGIPDKDTPEYQEFRNVAGSFGYDIFIDSITSKDRTGKIILTFGNSGVAPFYYDWDLEYRLVDAKKRVVVYKNCDKDFRLSALLPDETAESTFFIPEDLNSGEYIVQMRFVNPAEEIADKAMPLRLSNDNEIWNGYYELGTVTVE